METIEAKIIKDECFYTIFFVDKDWGPVISDINLDEAKKKFTEAFYLCLAVKNLLEFTENNILCITKPPKIIFTGIIEINISNLLT